MSPAFPTELVLPDVGSGPMKGNVVHRVAVVRVVAIIVFAVVCAVAAVLFSQPAHGARYHESREATL
jgi:hypothetical protein